MSNSDQQEMLDVLAKQRQHQLQVDRILKIVLPIIAFLLAAICANLNVWSTVLTLVMLCVSFYAVGIKRLPLWHWTTFILIYCLIDNILSYGSFQINGFARHFGTMTTFLWILGIGRPYFDHWLMKKEQDK